MDALLIAAGSLGVVERSDTHDYLNVLRLGRRRAARRLRRRLRLRLLRLRHLLLLLPLWCRMRGLLPVLGV